MSTQPALSHDATFALADILSIDPVWIAGTILILTYAVLVTEKINRAILAMLGAGLMIILGILNQEQAINGIDFNTLALLIGMMVIVSVTSQSGLFQYVAIKSAKSVKANPMGILIMLMLVTMVFSALLDNVTTVLLIAPITLLITDALGVRVFPYFFAEILASNIGGTATLIGDPPNIIIGSAANLSFNQFVVNLAPVAIFTMLIVIVIIFLIYRKDLTASDEAREKIMLFRENEAITDKGLVVKSLATLALVIFGFTVGHSYGIQPGTSALAGGALILFLAYWKQDPETQNESVHHIFSEVEWVTIFFFAGLFIIVAGVEQTGILHEIGQKMINFTDGDMMQTAFIVLWVSGILSALLDNIPFVATMIPLIESTESTFGSGEAIHPLWWSLALGACFGGNGSLIGASANLTVAAYAAKAKQPIGFIQFTIRAFPIMLLTLAIANVYIWLRYF
ncbi:ArsB/NhaD family transporter [Ostreibacterium oceani]|uniref:Citrate transporter-like domain-containing protein n=1 Tax=Ostreibacterium oceani TaxID=2654998 RepID=A0A6N7EZL1_9GAMM|nr:ArsB/NhaD family transporter [Ostreibacterium oceani]MPV85948.1 hypothetical protein [Ostreibacterium oceani]